MSANKTYWLWLVILTIIFIGAYLLLPVWLTPGNSLAFQVSLLTAKDYILFIALSFTTAVLILMHFFLFLRSRDQKKKAKIVGQSGVSLSSALFGGLLATAACSACIASLIGFLGAGSVFFVLKHQWYIVSVALALVLISLYFAAKKIQGYCQSCNLPYDKH